MSLASLVFVDHRAVEGYSDLKDREVLKEILVSKVLPVKLDHQVLLVLADIPALLDLLDPLVKMVTRAMSDLLVNVVLRETMVQWDHLVLKDLLDCKALLAHQGLLESLEPLVFKVHPVVREAKVLVV